MTLAPSPGLHAGLPPSAWVLRFAHLVPAGGRLLDVACGSGRHLHAFDGRGLRLVGVDRDAVAVEPLRSIADITVADIEAGPWPFAGCRFDALVVTHYLWRPLLPVLGEALAPGGVCLYETFSQGHELLGRPSNPDFLLRPRELLGWAATLGWQVVAYEDGWEPQARRVVQRIAAVNPGSAGRIGSGPGGTWPLTSGG
jgi:SAM-dependent methyltransferase